MRKRLIFALVVAAAVASVTLAAYMKPGPSQHSPLVGGVLDWTESQDKAKDGQPAAR